MMAKEGSEGSELGLFKNRVFWHGAAGSRSKPPPTTHHHGSVNIKVLIRNRTKGGDSLRCNLSLTNGIKNLIGFASLAVK